MIKIGKYNRLRVVKNVDFGTYLDGGEAGEILLPGRYVSEPLQPGDEIEVFIYRDNEGRLIATTEHPAAQVGEFAYLRVTDVNRTGAFLDWGLMKQLLLPYGEQTMKLCRGMVILVYVYLDDASKRIEASAKIDKFLGNRVPRYHQGEPVKALVYRRNELGYKAIVDNLYHGLIYDSDLYKPLVIGKEVTAYIKNVREDGKIDLIMSGSKDGRVDALAERVMARLDAEPDGYLPLTDSSSPEAISHVFECSKKDYKKALGKLYKERRIVIEDDGIRKA